MPLRDQGLIGLRRRPLVQDLEELLGVVEAAHGLLELLPVDHGLSAVERGGSRREVVAWIWSDFALVAASLIATAFALC